MSAQLTPWQVVEIVAEESDQNAREMTVADMARVRWADSETGGDE
jgi:hypothetical protein